MLPDGWLDEPEAEELRRLAEGKTVLELGAWKGRSTVVFAEVAKYVVSVDRHRGIPEHPGDSLPEYLLNVRALPNVAMVVASFTDFVPLLGRYFNMVYIDGDHDTESVRRDTEFALLLKPQVVVWHDWDFESVRLGAAAAIPGVAVRLVGSVASWQAA